MPQYISDNTDDEISHAAFLNHYLISKGEQWWTSRGLKPCPLVGLQERNPSGV
jgi:hypothetical protein